jgi:hypothetical protein
MKKMATIFASAIAALALATIQTQARPYHTHHATSHRHQVAVSYGGKPSFASGEAAGALISLEAPTMRPEASPASRRLAAMAARGYSEVVGGISSACRRWSGVTCGCEISLRFFGRVVNEPNLKLAINYRIFEPAAPGPGTVAYRPGHVFEILRDNGDGTVKAWDPNSGGRLTRIHDVSLRGYRVVRPDASRLHIRMARR